MLLAKRQQTEYIRLHRFSFSTEPFCLFWVIIALAFCFQSGHMKGLRKNCFYCFFPADWISSIKNAKSVGLARSYSTFHFLTVFPHLVNHFCCQFVPKPYKLQTVPANFKPKQIGFLIYSQTENLGHSVNAAHRCRDTIKRDKANSKVCAARYRSSAWHHHHTPRPVENLT